MAKRRTGNRRVGLIISPESRLRSENKKLKLRIEELEKQLPITAVVQVCDKCNIKYTYDWHHQYYTCSKCGNDK